MAIEDIKKELEERFAEPLDEFYKRRIIFWNDEDRDFEEEVTHLTLSNAKVIMFYVNNKIATITRNSGQSINALLPPQQLLEKYSHLESGYYTVDYAELEAGSWKIIEAGDGQVSGLAEHQDYEQYFKVLYEYLNE